MELEEFVSRFAEEFDETPAEMFAPDTKFKTLEEWGSLTALSIMAMVDDEMEKRITGSDFNNCETIEDLYKLAMSK